jgi:hypothetical protein
MKEEVLVLNGWFAICIEDEYFTDHVLSLLYEEMESRHNIESNVDAFCSTLKWISDKGYNNHIGFTIEYPRKEKKKMLKILNKGLKKHKLRIDWASVV